MTILTNKSLPRRTFLRGLGSAVALPFLDAMSPALAAPNRNAAAQAIRLAFVYVPNGIIMKDWTPAASGAAFEFPRTLKPVERFKDDLLVLSGLAHHNGQALGDGPGDHARAGATWLTGVHPHKTQGADIQAGISVDQIVAKEYGKHTQLASLELAMEANHMVGNCDSGYSCAYTNTISWSSPTTPLPPEVNPRAVFERLFGDGESTDPAVRALQARQDRSILDFVRTDAARLQAELGATDRRKLSQYLDAIRDVERRIRKAEEQNASGAPLPTLERPSGVPPTFEEHVQLMFDLQVIAFQADLTRVITFMMGREGSNRTYRSIGVPEAHHGLTHHQNDTVKIEKIQKIDQHQVEMFAYFLDKLKTTADGDGSLLDHAMVLYGSSISDGNRHLHHDLPLLLAGRAGSTIRPGRHVQYSERTPMANLFLNMLDKIGIREDKVGDSSGKLEYLSDV